MIDRYVKAILINIGTNSHRFVWSRALTLLFVQLASLYFVLNVIKVVLILLDHFLTFPQLFQGIIGQMYRLLDSPHFKGSYVKRVVVIISGRVLHSLSKIQLGFRLWLRFLFLVLILLEERD